MMNKIVLNIVCKKVLPLRPQTNEEKLKSSLLMLYTSLRFVLIKFSYSANFNIALSLLFVSTISTDSYASAW